MRSKNRKRAFRAPANEIERTTEREARIARAAAYLAATRDEFIANFEKAKRHLADLPEGGLLAGPAAKK